MGFFGIFWLRYWINKEALLLLIIRKKLSSSAFSHFQIISIWPLICLQKICIDISLSRRPLNIFDFIQDTFNWPLFQDFQFWVFKQAQRRNQRMSNQNKMQSKELSERASVLTLDLTFNPWQKICLRDEVWLINLLIQIAALHKYLSLSMFIHAVLPRRKISSLATLSPVSVTQRPFLFKYAICIHLWKKDTSKRGEK